MRVVFDTNVVVSAFLSPTGAPAQVLSAWERQIIELVVSEALLEEYQRVLLYERVASRHQMAPDDVAEIIEGFRQFALVVEPQETLAVITEDPADNALHAMPGATTTLADYIFLNML